jgi:hypothetical protein
MRKYSLKAPGGVVADYFRLFVNRRAYTLQSDRPNPDSGRHYYYRPTDKKTGQGLSLTLDTIRCHIESEITIAPYAINPANQRCKWVAIDADYKNALADLIKLGYYLKQDGVESALEKSNRGGHLWVLIAQPVSARRVLLLSCPGRARKLCALAGAGDAGPGQAVQRFGDSLGRSDDYPPAAALEVAESSLDFGPHAAGREMPFAQVPASFLSRKAIEGPLVGSSIAEGDLVHAGGDQEEFRLQFPGQKT